MKRTNIRVHRNGGSKSVSPQVPNKPEATSPGATGTAVAHWWRKDGLQLLINSKDKAQDCLWASPKGQLYLWGGDMDTEPRAITLETGREWWEKFRHPEFEFAAPYFKEGTAAAQLVLMVCHYWAKVRAEQPISAPLCDELENSIDQAEALVVFMNAEIERKDQGGRWNGDIENGFVQLHTQTFARLRRAKNELFAAAKGVTA